MGHEATVAERRFLNPKQVFTIGHSNHPLETFLEVLGCHHLQVVVDTRSRPYSKYAPQYDHQMLRQRLQEIGIQYLFMGKELGGRPEGDEYYDSKGHVLYFRVAESPLFLEGVRRIETGIEKFKLALLCSEEDPAKCHRHLLIGRVLAANGIAVHHIRGDGRVQSEEELLIEEREKESDPGQLALFDVSTTAPWKSIPSVSRKRQPRSFSAR